MLISRGLQLAKIVQIGTKSTHGVQSVRNSSHNCYYRTSAPPAPKHIIYIAEAVGGVAWWWVLWHLWTEPGHIFGEFEYPDPRQWTDEELGIPPVE